MNASKFIAAYADLPASTAIQIAYDKNYTESYTNVTQVTDTDRKIIMGNSEGLEATVIQLKATFTTSSDNTPLLESVALTTR